MPTIAMTPSVTSLLDSSVPLAANPMLASIFMGGLVNPAARQQILAPKEARELFVGNVLAQGVNENVLKEFLNSAMRQVGDGSHSTVITCCVLR